MLDIDDEVAGAKVHVIRQRHLDGDRRKLGHNRVSVRIHKVQLQVVFALVAAGKGDPQGDGALRMDRWQLLGVDGVECPQQVQLAIVIRRRVAQHCHLNVHPATMKTQVPRIRTH